MRSARWHGRWTFNVELKSSDRRHGAVEKYANSLSTNELYFISSQSQNQNLARRRRRRWQTTTKRGIVLKSNP